MKSLKIILSMVVLLFATHAINAQQSRAKAQPPKEVTDKPLKKDANKLEHQELKKERKAVNNSRKRRVSKAKVDKAESKHYLKRSRKGYGKKKTKAERVALKNEKKAVKSRKNIKHKKRPAIKAGKE